MLRYFFCKVICICQNGSVAGRQPPGEDVGEGCSVPAAYQNGRSSISNILGNSWGLPIHVLRVVCIFSLLWGRRFAPPSWLRLDCRHCMSLCKFESHVKWENINLGSHPDPVLLVATCGGDTDFSLLVLDRINKHWDKSKMGSLADMVGFSCQNVG